MLVANARSHVGGLNQDAKVNGTVFPVTSNPFPQKSVRNDYASNRLPVDIAGTAGVMTSAATFGNSWPGVRFHQLTGYLNVPHPEPPFDEQSITSLSEYPCHFARELQLHASSSS